MPDQPGNVYPIDSLAHSAATDPHLLELHKVVVESDRNPEVPDELAVTHRVCVAIVRNEVSGALRAAADWMDQHPDMFIDGITVENHYRAADGKTASEVRFFVEFQ